MGRLVVDLRALNEIMIPNNYPLPQQDIIQVLHGARYITATDASLMLVMVQVLGNFVETVEDNQSSITLRGFPQLVVKMELITFRVSIEILTMKRLRRVARLVLHCFQIP